MSDDDLRDEIAWLFDPKSDEDGSFPREYPDERLRNVYRLGFAYMDAFNYEGSSAHKYTRLCGKDDAAVHKLTRNSDVPTRLLEAALRLFGESILAYADTKERVGGIRFYPPILFTCWAGFEAFLAYTSELMLSTVKEVPEPIANYLREIEPIVEKGKIRRRTRYQPVLERFAVLLQYGYGYTVDRGSTWWQRLEDAKKLRDYYTHLDVDEARAIRTTDISTFVESVLLAIIWPSSELQRTLHLGIFHLYNSWLRLTELAKPFTEQPFCKDWPMNKGYLFHCNFANVDVARFPSLEGCMARRERPAH